MTETVYSEIQRILREIPELSEIKISGPEDFSFENESNAYIQEYKTKIIEFLKSDKIVFNPIGGVGIGKTKAEKEIEEDLTDKGVKIIHYCDQNQSKPTEYIKNDIEEGKFDIENFFNLKSKTYLIPNENQKKCHIVDFWYSLYHKSPNFSKEEKEITNENSIPRMLYEFGCSLEPDFWNPIRNKFDPSEMMYKYSERNQKFNCQAKTCGVCWHNQLEEIQNRFKDKKHGQLLIANIRQKRMLDMMKDVSDNAHIICIDEDPINTLISKFELTQTQFHTQNCPVFADVKDFELKKVYIGEKPTYIITTEKVNFKINYGFQHSFLRKYPMLYFKLNREYNENIVKMIIQITPSTDLNLNQIFIDVKLSTDEELIKNLLYRYGNVTLHIRKQLTVNNNQKLIFISSTSPDRIKEEGAFSDDEICLFHSKKFHMMKYTNPCFLIVKRCQKETKNMWGKNASETDLIDNIERIKKLGFKHPLIICKKEFIKKLNLVDVIVSKFGYQQAKLCWYPSLGSNEFYKWKTDSGDLITIDSVWVLGRFGLDEFTHELFSELGFDVKDEEMMRQTIGRGRLFLNFNIPVFLFCDENIAFDFQKYNKIYKADFYAFVQNWEEIKNAVSISQIYELMNISCSEMKNGIKQLRSTILSRVK